MSTTQGGPTSGPPGLPARYINVQEANTHLSALLARVAAGERIVLARHGKPCAQLVPLDPSQRRQLGFLPGRVDAAFSRPCLATSWIAGGREATKWRALNMTCGCLTRSL